MAEQYVKPQWVQFQLSRLSTISARMDAAELGTYFKLYVYAIDNDGLIPQSTRDLCRVTGQSPEFVAEFVAAFEGDLLEPRGAGYVLLAALDELERYRTVVQQKRGAARTRWDRKLKVVDEGGMS